MLLEMQAKAAAATPHQRRHFVINPVVGPEAIQGSSRLKVCELRLGMNQQPQKSPAESFESKT